jgi:hypothetical protein
VTGVSRTPSHSHHALRERGLEGKWPESQDEEAMKTVRKRSYIWPNPILTK